MVSESLTMAEYKEILRECNNMKQLISKMADENQSKTRNIQDLTNELRLLKTQQLQSNHIMKHTSEISENDIQIYEDKKNQAIYELKNEYELKINDINKINEENNDISNKTIKELENIIIERENMLRAVSSVS